MNGLLIEKCLWQKGIGVDCFGQKKHDDGISIRCRKEEKQKMIKNVDSKEIISAASYYIRESVSIGDLIDGCEVRLIVSLVGLFGSRLGFEVFI